MTNSQKTSKYSENNNPWSSTYHASYEIIRNELAGEKTEKVQFIFWTLVRRSFLSDFVNIVWIFQLTTN